MNPPSSGDRAIAAAWRAHRPYLVNLAYQMLHDVGEAEDVAQEAFLRLSGVDLDEIGDVRGWLTVVAGRLCLDQLRSARVRLVSKMSPDQEARLVPVDYTDDPADHVTLDDEVSSALLEVLRRLSPAERVAFILHDVFAVPFDDIAESVGRPVGTCRQLARRARMKFSTATATATARPVHVAAGEHRRVTDAFITACANGDVHALTSLLDTSVWGVGTVLAHPAPAPQVKYGPGDVVANLLHHIGSRATLVCGPPGDDVLLAFDRGRLFAVIVLTIRHGLVMKIEATADPSARQT